MYLHLGVYQVSLDTSPQFLAVHMAPMGGVFFAEELTRLSQCLFHHCTELTLPENFYFDVFARPSTQVNCGLKIKLFSLGLQVLSKV